MDMMVEVILVVLVVVLVVTMEVQLVVGMNAVFVAEIVMVVEMKVLVLLVVLVEEMKVVLRRTNCCEIQVFLCISSFLNLTGYLLALFSRFLKSVPWGNIL